MKFRFLKNIITVKGLAEVTEKQARGQPQLQAIFATGSGKKRSRKRKGRNSNKEPGETSETDEESVAPTPKRHNDVRPPSQRLGSQRLREAGDHSASQIEPSRILEQSMATAEVCLYQLVPGNNILKAGRRERSRRNHSVFR